MTIQTLLTIAIVNLLSACHTDQPVRKKTIHADQPTKTFPPIDTTADAFKARERLFIAQLQKEYIVDTILINDVVSWFNRDSRRAVYYRDINLSVKDTSNDISIDKLKTICRDYYCNVLQDTVNYSYASLWYAAPKMQTGVLYLPQNDFERVRYFHPTQH